jgi:hypothetical protein
MSGRKGLPKYRPGISRFAVAELDTSKNAHRYSIARIDGKLRNGASWRVTEDMFTSRQADRIAERLNRLARERAAMKADCCVVLNLSTLETYLCPRSSAKELKPPDLIVD